MSEDVAILRKRRDELLDRIEKIKQDYQSGLDADSEERAQQLENAEVLEGILQAATEELAQVEQKLANAE